MALRRSGVRLLLPAPSKKGQPIGLSLFLCHRRLSRRRLLVVLVVHGPQIAGQLPHPVRDGAELRRRQDHVGGQAEQVQMREQGGNRLVRPARPDVLERVVPRGRGVAGFGSGPVRAGRAPHVRCREAAGGTGVRQCRQAREPGET